MRCESLNQLYEIFKNKLENFSIDLNIDSLQIKNSSNHFIKIIYNKGFFDVFIDNAYYLDVDKYDIEETIESIMSNYILLKDDTAHVLSLQDINRIRKKDENAHIIKL